MPTSPRGTVEVCELWKRFRADDRPTYLQDQVGRLRDRLTGRSQPSFRWALADVNLRAVPGDSWGLVGANGAGKSTLLKILSRVMYPTAGRVGVTGRVGALIEVRAGISPLLTGRENIFLTGSIMGLKRREVARRFDDIVAFAELEHAIDRQVKYFSSGMTMRLGFGVASFLQPDVLLVDEVLAVGDATFQQRCLDRIRTVLAEGATLFFVSHDLAAVEATCTNGLWVHNGRVRSLGPVRAVLGAYRAAVEGEAAQSRHAVEGLIGVTDVSAGSPHEGPVATGGPLDVDITFQARQEHRCWVYLGISEGAATPIFMINPGRETILAPGATRIRATVPSVPLPRGRYFVWAGVYEHFTNGTELLAWQPVASFDVHGPDLDVAPRAIVRLSPLHVASDWEIGTGAASVV